MLRKNIYIICTILICSSLANNAQTTFTAEKFNIDIPYYSSSNFIAKNEIHLLPGFSFQASGNSNFHASIDNFVIPETVDGGNGDPSRGLITGFQESATNPAAAPPGTLPGNIDVSSTGVATYSIPFDLPKGYGGITPQLGIAYSSQSGRGLLGQGWDLVGISAITRTGSTKYFDNMYGSVKFDGYDNFAIDGQRLLSSNINGIYYKENEDFSYLFRFLKS